MWSDVVVDGDVPEPVEIDLIPHAPPPGRGARRGRGTARAKTPEPDPDGHSEQHAEPRSDRSRLVMAVAVSLALVLGWVLGRATTGGTGPASDDASVTEGVTTVATPLATLPIVGEEIDGADFEEEPAEEPSRPPVGPDSRPASRPDSEPTSQPDSQPTSQPIAVDARLAGVPVRLVGVELGGHLVEVDLASGTLTDFWVDPLVADGNPLVIGPDWVAVTSNGRARVIRSDGTDTPVDVGDHWRLLNVPGTELFWRTSFGGTSAPGGAFELVDLDGEPVGPTIELPAGSWPALVDPVSGGIVVVAAGNSYAVTPDAVRQLATGDIVGITDAILVTYDCDEALVCSLYRVDRTTGEVVPVPPDRDLSERYHWGSMAGWGSTESASLSPDERWVTVIGSSWRSSVAGIVELETGRFVELSQLSSPPAVAWSPDGRWAFTLDERIVTAYDTFTGERFPVFTDVVQWIQLGARPLAPAGPEGAAGGSKGATLLSAAAEETVER